MKYIAFLLLLPLFGLSQESNDPEATLILDKLSSEISDYKRIHIDFDLIVDYPEALEETKSGKLIQDGTKFYVDIAEQEIINDGKDLYMIFKEDNTAQINSSGSEGSGFDIFNPIDFINLYKSGEYIYGITGEEDINNERVILIEFKPIDRYSEFSKIRVAINKNKDFPKYLKIFNKDGSRITLIIQDFKLNASIDDSIFTFNKEKYPGIVVEDLRID